MEKSATIMNYHYAGESIEELEGRSELDEGRSKLIA